MNNEELLFELRILRDEVLDQIAGKPVSGEVSAWRNDLPQLYRRREALYQLIREKQYAINGPRIDGGKCDCCERGGEYNGFSSGPLKFVCPHHCVCHD